VAGLLPGCDKKAGRMMQEYSENQGRLLLSFYKRLLTHLTRNLKSPLGNVSFLLSPLEGDRKQIPPEAVAARRDFLYCRL
jgi:hypothetical protein